MYELGTLEISLAIITLFTVCVSYEWIWAGVSFIGAATSIGGYSGDLPKEVNQFRGPGDQNRFD